MIKPGRERIRVLPMKEGRQLSGRRSCESGGGTVSVATIYWLRMGKGVLRRLYFEGDASTSPPFVDHGDDGSEELQGRQRRRRRVALQVAWRVRLSGKRSKVV